MKLSEQWLREWVNPSIDTAELVEQLTMAGLEVDAVEPVAGEFNGVIVAEITAAEQHPDADKLRVCQVNSGSESFQVVCGAPNARVGIKVPFATVGAVLPGDFKIKKAKLRGVESFGMLCAEQELGLSDASDGLMELPSDATIGQDIREYLQLNDQLIEVDLTPNRADCLSISGIAREVGLLNKAPINSPVITPAALASDATFAVRIESPEDCPHYVGRVIKHVDLSKPSPLWMQEKLRRSGIRSIDAVVDVTNYVLLELGQPMHAFDLNQLNGSIVVRKAKANEELVLLDGQELKLNSDSLVIADEKRALALAGIMGGQDSGVTAETQDIFLESAFFTPELLAGKARNYGLHTDSSHRFERGVDPLLQVNAIERATELLLQIVGGEAGPIVEETAAQQMPEQQNILLRAARIKRVLGFEMSAAEVEDILTRLGVEVTAVADGWQCKAPSWRFDMAIEEDLLEELARVYGYNRLPVTKIHSELSMQLRPEKITELGLLRRHLASRDYQEAITYSFIDPKSHANVCGEAASVELLNPISADMSVMRTSLWPGLLNVARYNLNRQQSRVRLFETGRRYLPQAGETLPVQAMMIAGLIVGRRSAESWSENNEQVDFYDLKADVETLLAVANPRAVFTYKLSDNETLHPGQSADVYLGDEKVGCLGKLHPETQKKMDVSQPVFVFELNAERICEGLLPEFKELSKFPEIRRDLAIIIDKEKCASDVLSLVEKQAGENLIDLKVFDVYAGQGIDPTQKSLALGLTFQHSSRTLNEEEINQTIEQVVSALKSELNAVLR